eukprot:CAMPEP_0117506892 /NCGR_PEP_ID=MMETSP0784-20121206/26144_1 /TAXON_ID=39447 /ORGANISM="" /LENGTH=77 /DNA_ID=CAMNT_0005302383 /DNA_START=1139 /DNA_END=1372 /DNA_ORIENTATION=+
MAETSVASLQAEGNRRQVGSTLPNFHIRLLLLRILLQFLLQIQVVDQSRDSIVQLVDQAEMQPWRVARDRHAQEGCS